MLLFWKAIKMLFPIKKKYRLLTLNDILPIWGNQLMINVFQSKALMQNSEFGVPVTNFSLFLLPWLNTYSPCKQHTHTIIFFGQTISALVLELSSSRNSSHLNQQTLSLINQHRDLDEPPLLNMHVSCCFLLF